MPAPTGRCAIWSRPSARALEARLPELEQAGARCCCCPRTRPTRRTPSWRSAPAPAATRRRCSPATSSACTSATPTSRAGRCEILLGQRGRARRLSRKSSPRSPGDGVFGRLKFESGVHRVQRVPETEAQGRIHTSAATVAVLPEAEDVDIEINDEDLRIDIYRASRRRRPARQQDRLGGAHHPSADRHRGDHPGREVAAQEPGARRMKILQGPALRPASASALDDRARRRPQEPGRLRRPLRAHPHLQFPAGPGDRPPHQPDPLQARPGHGGRGAGRGDRAADHRGPGRPAGRVRVEQHRRGAGRGGGGAGGGGRPQPALRGTAAARGRQRLVARPVAGPRRAAIAGSACAVVS